MTVDERIDRLENQNRRLLQVLGCSVVAIIALSLVAAADLVNIVVGKVEVKNNNGETRTTLLPNGDVEVGGNLSVRGSLTIADSNLVKRIASVEQTIRDLQAENKSMMKSGDTMVIENASIKDTNNYGLILRGHKDDPKHPVTLWGNDWKNPQLSETWIIYKVK